MCSVDLANEIFVSLKVVQKSELSGVPRIQLFSLRDAHGW
jgi:hypothetical protein